MFKEIEDLRGACENIAKKSDDIKNLAKDMVNLIDQIKASIKQENAVEMTLAVRKELANIFILNSNIEDNFKILQKIYNSIKNLNK
jgi:chorismate mutase